MFIRALILSLLTATASWTNSQEDQGASDLVMDSLQAPEVAYEGEVSIFTRNGRETRSREVLLRFSPPASFRRQIVDQLGIPTWTIVSDGKIEWVYDRRRRTVFKGEPADPDYKLLDPDEEYRLMSRNYAFRLAGSARVAVRPCKNVEVRTRDGRLVQRMSVDLGYGIVLERETYGVDGAVVSNMRFVRLEIPADDSAWDFRYRPPPGANVVRSVLKPDSLGLDEAAGATDMRPMIAGWLPQGYVFESVNLLPYHGATLLHYRYTDGIEALSLFQCPRRAELDFGSSPIQEVRVNGRAAVLGLHQEGKILEWTSGDRFVLLGRLGAETLRRVAESIKEVRP
jgi:outer membrane lipoprotein-sorting protein